MKAFMATVLMTLILTGFVAAAQGTTPIPKNIVDLIDCSVNGKPMTKTSHNMPGLYFEAVVDNKTYSIVGTNQNWIQLIVDDYMMEIPFASNTSNLPFFLNIQKSGLQILCTYK